MRLSASPDSARHADDRAGSPATCRRTRGRRLLSLAIVALIVALVPLSLLAAGFTDLDPASPHNDNINAIAAAGITRGCNPPTNDNYCPKNTVTREEMASFLARTAGLGSNPPIANAASAQNAAQLGGQPASFYQPAGQTIASAANASTVGGYAPNGLVRAAGAAAFPPLTVSAPFDNQATARWTPMLATAVAAPGAGYVLVTASVNADGFDAACNGASGTACTFNARLWDGGTAVSPWISTVVNNNGNRYGSVTVTYLFPVAAGNRTMTLEASTDAPFVNKVKGYNATMTALFVPFNGTGTTP